MTPFKQRTIVREGRISGTGLHTGVPCTLVLKPAPVDAGISFFSDGRLVGRLSADSELQLATDTLRCSAIGSEKNRILTVEHLLACLRGLEITNLVVEVQGPEVPGLDGSALGFVRLFKELGLQDQAKPADFYRISEPIFCYDKQKTVAIYPAETFSVSYVLDYEHPFLRDQKADFELTPESFEKEIAPARTFCTDKEAAELQKHGFGLGANVQNTLVVREDGSHVKDLRFENECARHKILDILGDMHLLGFPVLGRIIAIRSGHTLNRQLVQQIKKQRSK